MPKIGFPFHVFTEGGQPNSSAATHTRHRRNLTEKTNQRGSPIPVAKVLCTFPADRHHLRPLQHVRLIGHISRWRLCPSLSLVDSHLCRNKTPNSGNTMYRHRRYCRSAPSTTTLCLGSTPLPLWVTLSVWSVIPLGHWSRSPAAQWCSTLLNLVCRSRIHVSCPLAETAAQAQTESVTH